MSLSLDVRHVKSMSACKLAVYPVFVMHDRVFTHDG